MGRPLPYFFRRQNVQRVSCHRRDSTGRKKAWHRACTRQDGRARGFARHSALEKSRIFTGWLCNHA